MHFISILKILIIKIYQIFIKNYSNLFLELFNNNKLFLKVTTYI